MRISQLPSLLVVSLSLAACAVTASEDDVETDDNALGGSCVLGETCPTSMTLVSAVDYGGAPPARVRGDVHIDTTKWSQTPHVMRATTTRTMTANTNVSVRLRGGTPGSGFRVDNFLLIEVLDAARGSRIASAFVGITGGESVKLGGAPLARLGADSFDFAAGAIDLGPLLPKNRAFKLRVTALDYGGAASVTDVVADIVPSKATFTLAGNAAGTAPFYVDDDAIVRVNGVEVAHDGGGAGNIDPIHFEAAPGDTLSVSLVDTHGVCRANDDVWLSGPGITAVKAVAATPQICGNPATSEPFRAVEFKIGETPPAIVATERRQSVLRANGSPVGVDFTKALEVTTYAVTYRSSASFAFYRMLQQGFNLGPKTHTAFGGETNHFNIPPTPEVSPASIDGLVAWWQPKITAMRAKVSTDFQNGVITTRDRDAKNGVLDGLQRIIDESMKPLRATFDKYPEVSKVLLDAS